VQKRSMGVVVGWQHAGNIITKILHQEDNA
jgi:hypothetical protein